uniref:Uncharacterized protein n=1 Tax=Siphoviridae sp. ctDmQ3 TaxID=2823570 RepID=A0A8S5L8H7_9CAUD|nr:MAG TPA: hypothetical protein [Siphoviridae sp. ctDmQ3]
MINFLHISFSSCISHLLFFWTFLFMSSLHLIQ